MLDYFDAYLIGLTATPSKQTFGFFNKNLVMEYGHEQAVVDGVNVDFNVYRIATRITQGGSTVEAGYQVGVELEQRDIADLEAMLAADHPSDVDTVLTHLLRASRNHLAAY